MEPTNNILKKLAYPIFCIFLSFQAQSQYCDSLVPVQNVDLSASPNMSWVSPFLNRQGNCCGTTSPDNCLEFIITLNPNAIAVSFSITGGAVPPGALFYQVDCGPVTPVDSVLCLSGAGPHHLTFCKPGNNANEFTITSYSEPIIGPDITLNSACQGFLYAEYYNEPSMTWTSVFPGAPGAYDGLLSCTSGCDTTYVTAPNNPPAYIDYVVCGTDIGGCNPLPYCDTIRVNFITPVSVDVTPDSTHLCYGEPNIDLTANVVGGTPPYSFLWNNAATSQVINVGAGTYWVQVTDASGCLIAIDTAIIVQDSIPIQANAGADINTCQQSSGQVTLNGSVQLATGGIWSGGLGIFSPSNTNLSANYTPTPAELQNGSVQLILTTTGNGGCSADQDTVLINFLPFTNTFNLSTSDVLCNGDSNGSATVNVAGPFLPCNYSWDMAPITGSNWISGLAPGNHQVQIINSMGCDTTIYFTINEPSILNAMIDSIQPNLCFGDSNALAYASAAGGIGPYAYSWNSNPIQMNNPATNLPAGTYTCTVTDNNGCQDSASITIVDPSALTLNISGVSPDCNGNWTGAVSSTPGGGTPGYSFQWWNGPTSSNQYNLPAGTYIVTVTDANGCQITDSISLIDPPLLTGTITSDTIICPGTNLNIYTNITGGTGTYDYMWSPGGQTSSGIIVNPVIPTTYDVTVSDNNGCAIQLSTFVDIYNLMPSEISASINATTSCAGDSVWLTAQYFGNDPSVTLTWLHCPTCPTNQPVLEQPLVSTQYVLSATNSCGQTVYDTVSIIVNPLPNLNAVISNDDICPGEVVSFMNLGNNDPTWTYLWDFGDGNTSSSMNPTYSYSYGGYYPISLTITDMNGCVAAAIDYDTITVNFQVTADFDASTFFGSMMEPEIDFYNTSVNATSFLWNFGDGDTSTVINPSHEFPAAGDYNVTLYAMNSAGCDDSITLTIVMEAAFELYVPNAFTPDGDQYNNSFIPRGFGISEKGYEFSIYNRWGDLIFQTQDLYQSWDGTIRSQRINAQDGVYTWVVKFQDELGRRYEREGHVSLLK